MVYKYVIFIVVFVCLVSYYSGDCLVLDCLVEKFEE